jgi:7,8-dihydropterin-6-yl-methyl-4-(beta-D-ribofuranosyl)aminobenzene 5'-phosphate synthase
LSEREALLGKRADALTEATIEALLEIDPKVVVPMHCTSWKSSSRLQQAMPQAFVLNSVGTTLSLS